MNNAVVTPFNVFSALSFLLLAIVAIAIRQDAFGHFPVAAASAFFGFLLIIMFLAWTVLTEERES